MEPATILEPGFGWASSKKKLVSLEEGGKVVTETDMMEGFPSNFACDFIRTFCEEKGISFQTADFSSHADQILKSYLSSQKLPDEYDEFIKTGKSNGREMKWDIMSIQPNTSFKLHAHPNIEIIYVIQGAIHEFRYEGPQMKTYTTVTDICGPDLSAGVPGIFNYRCSRARDSTTSDAQDSDHKEFLVNEKGSVHQSFTREDGAILMILWSGCHADVPKKYFPPKGTIPDLPVGVEPMHKDDEEEK